MTTIRPGRRIAASRIPTEPPYPRWRHWTDVGRTAAHPPAPTGGTRTCVVEVGTAAATPQIPKVVVTAHTITAIDGGPK